MLILTRRIGEAIKIDDEIMVVVLSIKGNQIRLGIQAPLDTQVHRAEVYERIKQEEQSHPGSIDGDKEKS